MENSRSSSLLPTIKCSNCAVEIQISLLAGHMCNVNGNLKPLEPSLKPKLRSYLRPPTIGSYSEPILRSSRVNTGADDTSKFQSRPCVKPNVSSSCLSLSSLAITGSMRLPSIQMLRPPNSQLSHMDPILPSNSNEQPTANVLKTAEDASTDNPNSSSINASTSPKHMDNAKFMQKINRIAPGPFDMNGQRDLLNNAEKTHRRTGTAGSLNDIIAEMAAYDRRDHKPQLGWGHFRHNSNSSVSSKLSYVVPPKPPKKSGYEGFGPPVAGENSWKGFNFGIDQSISPRSPEYNHDEWKPDVEFSTQKLRPKRLSSNGEEVNVSSNLPPRFSPDDFSQEYDEPFSINPSLKSPESPKEKTSPLKTIEKIRTGLNLPKPLDYKKHQRKQSDLSKIDLLLAELESSMTDLRTKETSSISLPPQPFFTPSSSPTFTDYKNTFPGKQLNLNQITAAYFPPLSQSSLTPSSSPTATESKDKIPNEQLILNQKTIPILSPPISPARPDPQISVPPFQPSTISHPAPPPVLGKPRAHKSKCKKCGENIYGKSVSSSGGLLTGRYHKECFVCRTCQKPFKTATFYVIDNAPYCEIHYHQLNGSICSNCDKGIEGPYVESEYGQKLHPECLRCSDCKCILRNNYFEINGRVYCEHDAFNRPQHKSSNNLNPNKNSRMERRKTKLMMI
ncbi:LIM domain protein [Golovinomyces cichoracearum]|uniref:LIM domain protein n=1 Tax=Golovinomyces cichoracearum TaxID=62708 RepID=A0A420J1Q7_9PEZI|nr:LIM domain protein [Golovinomyces cichoracearum]